MAVTIDNYNQSRELYGVEQHTRSMRLASQWLQETFTGCHVFYWGSGHFVLVHPGTPERSCAEAARTLVERFQHPWEGLDTTVVLTASAVVLPDDLMPAGVENVTSIISHAFESANEINSRGGHLVTQEMLDGIAREREVSQALTRALSERHIEVYLQPIYSTREKKIVGAEALARLNDPDLGFIPPLEFITIAERNGDIMELGRQIFEQVCAFVEEVQPQRLGIQSINVNLSPAQCLSDRLSRDFSRIASAHGVGLDAFDFEVTESSIGDLASIGRQLEVLGRSGATFALDDFGTGVSNLTRLMGLPIDVVKLDVDVVQAYFLGTSSLLPDLVQMFRNAGMKTVLEGVETHAMMEGAQRMGADYQQGYYFSRPLPPDQFVSFLETQALA